MTAEEQAAESGDGKKGKVMPWAAGVGGTGLAGAILYIVSLVSDVGRDLEAGMDALRSEFSGVKVELATLNQRVTGISTQEIAYLRDRVGAVERKLDAHADLGAHSQAEVRLTAMERLVEQLRERLRAVEQGK